MVCFIFRGANDYDENIVAVRRYGCAHTVLQFYNCKWAERERQSCIETNLSSQYLSKEHQNVAIQCEEVEEIQSGYRTKIKMKTKYKTFSNGQLKRRDGMLKLCILTLFFYTDGQTYL